jgi:hypothetical protein
VCKAQADERDISDEKFGEAMAGDAIANASMAFLDELADFTPDPRDRRRVHKVLKAQRDLAKRASKLADEKLDEELAKAMSGLSSGKLPERSESTPAP